ncbi:MAG TPA: MmcQ/YjbR family DNA-binding protein [Bryobacteraceae bacterium]|nr:MmcQ/YjbR family DNA-binding protein [Bryobacteraceae bacterium]
MSKIALVLPETSRQMQGKHASFRVRKKIFAYYLDDHHGDGIVGITCKVLPNDNTALIAVNPERFYMPAYVGPSGWVGLRLDLGAIDWEEVGELIAGSYRLLAPKTLARRVAELA